SRILDMGKLMPALIDHLRIRYHESILDRIVIEFRAGISVRYRNLDGFHIQFFREVNGVVDRLASFARQPEYEVTMDNQAQLMTILSELSSTLDSRALLDVLQYLLVA